MIHCLLYILMSSFYFFFYLNSLLLFLHVNRSEVNNGIHTLHVTSPTAQLYKNIWDHWGAPMSRNQEEHIMENCNPQPPPIPPLYPLCTAMSEMCKFMPLLLILSCPYCAIANSKRASDTPSAKMQRYFWRGGESTTQSGDNQSEN